MFDFKKMRENATRKGIEKARNYSCSQVREVWLFALEHEKHQISLMQQRTQNFYDRIGPRGGGSAKYHEAQRNLDDAVARLNQKYQGDIEALTQKFLGIIKEKFGI